MLFSQVQRPDSTHFGPSHVGKSFLLFCHRWILYHLDHVVRERTIWDRIKFDWLPSPDGLLILTHLLLTDGHKRYIRIQDCRPKPLDRDSLRNEDSLHRIPPIDQVMRFNNPWNSEFIKRLILRFPFNVSKFDYLVCLKSWWIIKYLVTKVNIYTILYLSISLSSKVSSRENSPSSKLRVRSRTLLNIGRDRMTKCLTLVTLYRNQLTLLWSCEQGSQHNKKIRLMNDIKIPSSLFFTMLPKITSGHKFTIYWLHKSSLFYLVIY